MQQNDCETESANIELSGLDWQFRTTVSVPKAPMRFDELLPFVRTVTDAVVDATITSVKEVGRKISCKQGCGACCRQLVPLAEIEARALRDLVDAMPEPRRSEIRKRFSDAYRRLKSSGYWEKLQRRESWNDDEVQSMGLGYFFQGIACPFLEQECCSIYPDRPSACREYLVTSPAENCQRPNSDGIDPVTLPFKMWTALARFDKPTSSARFVRWVPLILALDWADKSSEPVQARPGMELLRELFEHIAKNKGGVRGEVMPNPGQPISTDSEERRGRDSDINPTSVEANLSSPSTVLANQDFPLRIGSDADFTHVESLLRTAHYDETTICRLLGIEDISNIGSIDRNKVAIPGLIGLIVRLFLFVESVPRGEAEHLIEPVTIQSLRALDLIRMRSLNTDETNPTEWYYSSVWLYPVAGLWIASDRGTNPDGSDLARMPDIVFPAIYEGTLRFLRVISKSAASDALDLCAGTGVAALAISKNVHRVVACDITARAAHFTQFNRWLNRCLNVEIAQGDLYGAVEGQSFDRIVAHPPFVPASSQGLIYRDAGMIGEALVQRIIEGLPRYLRRGGTFYAVCAAWDSTEGRFEERVRRWLGESEGEFNIIFALHRQVSPEEVAQRLPEVKQTGDATEAARWGKLFRGAGLETNVYGAIVIQRSSAVDDDRLRPFTRRMKMGAWTEGVDLEWALRWHAWRSQKEAEGQLVERIRHSKPRLNSHLTAKVTHVVQEGALIPADIVLEVDRPFPTASRIDNWMLALLANLNGQVTPEEVYDAGRAGLAIPDGFAFEDFAMLVTNMIERGCLEVDDALLAS